MKKINILVIIIIFLFSFNCKKSGNKKDSKITYPYTVATTVGMVTDIVKNVAKDKANISGIIGEGVDPHLYKPTRNDVVALQRADIIFYSGLLLEGKMSDIFVKMASSGKPVNAVTELLDEKYLLEPEGFQGHYDPHVWMDVSAWIKSVEVVAKKLSEFDPDNASFYKENALNYNKKLEKLDKYAKETILTIPKKSRILITAHDAFNYFGRAYDLEVMGIQGISTESEAGLEDLNKLVDLIAERDIKAVFVETSVSDKNIKALIEGAKSKGKNVKIGGLLFSDAMGKGGTYEGTYIGMIDHNVTTIVLALGGKASEKGMLGKLSDMLEH